MGEYHLWNVYLRGRIFNNNLSRTFATKLDPSKFQNFLIEWIPESDIPEVNVFVQVDMLSITEDYYNFIIDYKYETVWRGSDGFGGIFDGPPANISTNLDNGALGFFFAAGVSSYQFELRRIID